MQGINDLSTPAKIILASVSVYFILLMPAAMIFTPENIITPWILYVILVSISLLIVAPLLYVTYKLYWNGQKLLVAQISKKPLKSFEETISAWKEHTASNEARRFTQFQGAFFDKIFSAQKILFTSTIIAFILTILPIIAFPLTKYLWPLLYIGIMLVFKAYRGTFKEWQVIEEARNQQIVRIYEITKPVMKFELPPEYCVLVSSWDKETIPQQVIISYPPSFRGDSPQARDSFQSLFDASVTEEHAWIYTWHPTKNAVVIKPVESLPKFVEYRGSTMYEWHTFPIGVGLGPSGQEIITYNVASDGKADGSFYPHLLIAGSTGSGKSVIQRNILFHCIQHNDMWRFLGIDLKKVELSKYAKYSETVLGIATNIEEGTEVMRYAHDIMNKRYEKMTKASVDNFLDMIDEETGRPPYALLIMIDEAFMFLATSGNKTAQGKYEDELHNESAFLLGNIARLGRAAGIHLVLATQRPDATVIKGELKNNLDVRIAAGRLDNTPSLMVLDSSVATTLPSIKGRGIIRMSDKNKEFQGFFAAPDWIDKWLAKPQNRWREPEFTARMLGIEPKNKVRVNKEKKETVNPQPSTPEEILEEFLQSMEEEGLAAAVDSMPEQKEINTMEDIQEHVSLDEDSMIFEDELGILDDDEITDEEIEALLNELEKLEDEGLYEEGEEVVVKAISELSVKDITEEINKEKPFEIEFEEIFNYYNSNKSTAYSDDPFIKPQEPLRQTKTVPPSKVAIPQIMPSEGHRAPLPYEPLVENRRTITDVIKEIPKPPSLEQIKSKQEPPPSNSPKLPPRPSH
jgi:hypothetical protein